LPHLLALALGASPAAAASWSLGTQLGLAYISSGAAGEGTTTVVAWPANALTYEPGLRLAVGNDHHTRDLLLDTGWLKLDEAGSTLSMFVATASYQHVFRPGWNWSPFANAGAGAYREDAATVTRTSGRWGGGICVRHVVHEDHGALRFEARYDRLNANRDSGRPELNDLWL
jgi:hypothetical protein